MALKHGQGYCEISDTNLFSENHATTDTSVCSYVASPPVFGFSAASFSGKVILGNGATCSMGAVDQLAHVQHQFWQHGISLKVQSAKPLNFTFASGNEAVSHEVFPVPREPLHVIVTFRVLNAPGPILLGEEIHEQLALVLEHSTGQVYSKKLQWTLVAERFRPSRHLALDVCSPAIMTLRLLQGLESCTEESCGVLNSDPIESETTVILPPPPMSQS